VGELLSLAISSNSPHRQARWVSDDDVRKQNQFIDKLFDMAA
jgi:hypothetical protein